MPTITVNDSGTWKDAKEIFVKDSGVWKAVKEVHVKDAGVWKKAFPESGTQAYSTAGTYSFVVPNGIYSLTMPYLVAAGGGGGGSQISGDAHGGANGGSGGYYTNQTISVTPGETLTIVVGAGGSAGALGTGNDGTAGGSSSISRGATVLFSATGGSGGGGTVGDNAPTMKGYGGSPSGVDGAYQASWMVNRNTSGQGYNGGGQNGTGYGNGGLGANWSGSYASTVGGTGYVSLSW